MGKYRKRFNEKARAGMVAKQTALKRARQKRFFRQIDDNDNDDNNHENIAPAQSLFNSTENSNAEILVPMTEEEKELRRKKLREQLKADIPVKVSATKKKRLEKFIDKQVKKEEREEILSKLAKSTFDTSALASLKTLGAGNARLRKEPDGKKAGGSESNSDADSEVENDNDLHKPDADYYKERTVKDWREDEELKSMLGLRDTEEDTNEDPYHSKDQEKDQELTEERYSTFIDHRPRSSTGFGFQNIQKVTKVTKQKYNWRERLDRQKAMRHGVDLSDDSESEDEDEDEDEDEENGAKNEAEHPGSGESEEDEDSEEESEEESSGSEESEESEEWAGIQDKIHEGTSSSNYEDSNEDSDDPDAEKRARAKSASAFKEWANSVVKPKVTEGVEYPKFEGDYIPIDRPEDKEDLPAEIANQQNVNRRAFFVNVERSEDIQAQRLNLPVNGEEQKIMEAIHNNDCIIICGETGSGKTTQVPQFLFESGYGSKDSDNPGMIGITQPRRVAAVSMANRVSAELGNHGHRVGYQVRFDTSVSAETSLKFMTDGVLLKELMTDLTLSKYSAIIIDEAHERNVNTDILIGVLSRVLKLRRELYQEDPEKHKPLKLIVMSATLRVSDFTENNQLFREKPPVINVQARQFPVSVHFSRRTKFDYIDEAYRKAIKIHSRLPPGGILIFMTSQQEIMQLVKKLRKAFPPKDTNANKRLSTKDNYTSKEDEEVRVRVTSNNSTVEAEEIDLGDDELVLDEENEMVDDYDEEEEDGFEETLEEGQDANAPLHVLPLYSLLPTREQMKVFQTPPEGTRLCVVATNVAETSLTIPGIRYVVDTGRVKERQYNEDTQVQRFAVNWTSKASADQRAGRAGRTGPGHCYRLYSSAIYEAEFDQFSRPEIMRMPIEGLVLQMKAMGIDNIVNFPFPTPPSRTSLQNGLKLLRFISALDSKTDQLTEIGKSMSLFPLSPRFSKMVVIGNQLNCLPYVIAIVSALSVGDPFLTEQELGIAEAPETPKQSSNTGDPGEDSDDEDKENSEDEETVEEKEKRRQLRSKYFEAHAKLGSLDATSDGLKLLSAICAYDYAANSDTFCKDFFLRYKAMEEIRKLRQQISYIVSVNSFPASADAMLEKFTAKLKPPSSKQIQALKQMMAAGFIDQVAIRADKVDPDLPSYSKRNIAGFPYKTLFPVSLSENSEKSLVASDDEEQEVKQDPYVYIHVASVICDRGEIPPEFLVYHTIQQSQSSRKGKAPRIRIKPLTDVSASQLSNIAKSSPLITYSKPLGPPYGPKNITATKRECWVVPRFGAAIGHGGIGWDLPAKKVIQEKDGVHWVVK